MEHGFVDAVTNLELKAQLAESRQKLAIPPDAIARAIAFATEQPADIDVNEIVIRPTAQGQLGYLHFNAPTSRTSTTPARRKAPRARRT